MTEAQKLSESFVGLYEVLSEVFASLKKAILENVDKMVEIRKEAQEYIQKQEDTRKGWDIDYRKILRNQVNCRKPTRILARSNC